MGKRKIKSEHSGAKNGGGHWGNRKDAKQISKKSRRSKGKEEIRNEYNFTKSKKNPYQSSISLVPSDASYAEVWNEWRKDSAAKKYNPFAPSSVESLRERLSKAHSDISLFEQAENFIWFVKTGDDVVGNVNLHNINRTMLTAEIGYMISLQARGKGLATHCVGYLTQLCFEKTPLRKLIAYVHEDNAPSRRVLEKLGYKAEGLLREHYLVDGKPVNEVIYGLLSKDWMRSKMNRRQQ